MTDVKTQVAEPSPATVAETPVIDLHALNAEQRQTWREKGTFPEKAKPAEASDPSKATDPPKEVDSEAKAESAADPDPAKQQERNRHKPKPDAETRISELTAKNKELEERLRKREAEPSPTSKPEVKAETPKTRPRPSFEDKDEKGEPLYKTAEDLVEAVSDWKADQKIANYAQQQAFSAKVAEVRTRYPDADKVLAPAIEALAKPGEIDPSVYQMIDESPAAIHLIYALGSDAASFQQFLAEAKSNPRQAIRRVVLIEKMVIDELSGGGDKGKATDTPTPERGPDGKFLSAKESEPPKKDPPAQPETRTAKPLTEVGGRGTPGDDSLASAVKSGDYRSASAEMTRRALARQG